jgi:integrase
VPQANNVKRTSWSPREVRGFLDSVRDDRLAALWRLMCLTGVRRGEALGVRWIDLNMEEGTVRIEQQAVSTKEGIVFHPPKTDSGRRELALDEATLDAFREHRERQLVERAIFGPEYADSDLVFCHEDGRPLYPGNLSSRFATLRKRAGRLPHCLLHDLRHTHANLSLHAVGLHPELMRRRLGHARISTTVDLYMRGRAEAADHTAASAAAEAIDGATEDAASRDATGALAAAYDGS